MDNLERKVKLMSLLGLDPTDTSYYPEIDFIMANVLEIVLNYCNIRKLPAGLENTYLRMCMDMYNNNHGTDSGRVSSLKEGDVTVEFRAVDTSYSDSILNNYLTQLRRYRKVPW